jgi:hypothetical protein
MIGRVIPLPARDTKARTSVVTRAGDKVRIHPASVNSKLRVEKPEQNDNYNYNDDQEPPPPPPEFAALLFFDEITRGDSMLYIKSCTAMHPHPVMLVAAQVIPAPDEDNETNQERTEEDAGAAAGAAVGSVAEEVHGMKSMQLGEAVPPLSTTIYDNSTLLPDTGLLIVDGWLKFRVPIQTIAQLSTLRLRVASAFAAKVNRPRDVLPDILQKAMDVSAAIFINESESGDGVETDLGCSYKNNGGGRGGFGSGYSGGTSHGSGRSYGGRGGYNDSYRGGGGGSTGGRSGGNHSHHLFRYNHHAPAAPHRGGGGGGSWRGGPRGGGGGGGRGGGAVVEEQERSYEYRGGPYAQQQQSSGYGDYDDRHGGGVKRNHSGNPRESQPSTSRGGGRYSSGGGGRYSGGGGGRYSGGRSHGRYNDDSEHHQGRGRGGGRGRRGGGGRGGGRAGDGGY